ncbi:MAG: hypothetical protein LBC74_04215, partial [Planctomycetaceae bacterium]|nr:hypothetical protein [Planctomycetaceae bacterium]
MGILSDFLGLWSNSGGYESESVKRRKSLRNRICRIEEIEPREMLSATPYEPPELINVGVVFHEDYYVEQNYEDEGGDTFYVSWYGGADGTTLTELVIDLNVYDFSESLYFFADHEQPKGAYNTDPFGFTVSNDSEIIHSSYSLEGDGLLTKLTICFEAGKFTSGKQFIFKIDVNSYSNTTGDVESVLGGEHFKGSTIDAKFESENYKMLEVNGTFENIYDVPPELRVPLDQYDETSGQRNITAGAIEQATERQIPKEGSISGYVYKDKNNNGQKNDGENGIADVELTLWVWNENDEIYESLGTTRTDEQGQYRFG